MQYDNGNESAQIKNIIEVFFQVFFKCFSSIIINSSLVNDGLNSTVHLFLKFFE